MNKRKRKEPLKQKPVRRKKIRYKRILFLLILLVVIIFVCGNVYYKFASRAVDSNSKQEIIVDIPSGSTSKTIAKILYDKNLIRNERVFIGHVKETNQADKIKAGKYKFSKSMDNSQIIDKLIKGKIFQDGIKVTIPEGSVSTDIVNKLVAKGLGKRENYVKLFRNPSEFSDKYEFLKEKRIKTLEGFLYPETYHFKKESTEKEIFDKMIGEFNKNYNNKVKSYVEKNKLNFYDTVIMASIIEKEAVKDKDRAIISGIFYNRLDKKMKLQSDAVLQYGLPERKSRVLYSDLKIETPYNMYIHSGLPPTPIASPGIKSLEAAANPEKTDYLYFVTNVDGENSYSKTFEEHKKNAEKFHKDAYGVGSENKDDKESNSSNSSKSKSNSDVKDIQ